MNRVIAAGCLLTLALVQGCAVDEPDVVEVQIPAAAADFFGRVDSVTAQIQGTPEQVANVNIRDAKGEQADYADCMSRSGFDYPTPVVDWIIPDLPAYTPSWWARPSMAAAALGIGYARPYRPDPASLRSADPSTSYDALPEERKAAYDTALDACVQAVSADANAAYQQLLDRNDLEASLLETMTAASNSADMASVREAYAACMTREGVEAATPMVLVELADRATTESGLQALDPRSPEFSRRQPAAFAREVALARKDVTCRAPLAAEIARALAPELDTWIEDNAAELDDVSRGWTELGG